MDKDSVKLETDLARLGLRLDELERRIAAIERSVFLWIDPPDKSLTDRTSK